MASRLSSLIEVGRAISQQTDYPRLFHLVIEKASECLNAEGGTFYLYDDNTKLLHAVIAINQKLGLDHVITTFNPSDIKGLFTVPVVESQGVSQKSISAKCCLIKRPVVVKDTGQEEEFDLSSVREFDRKHKYHTRSIIAVPLLDRDDQPLGVVQVINPANDLSSSEDIDLVEAMASIMGMAVENNLLLQGTEQLLNAVVEMISATIDERSKVTGGHCFRVTVLTMMLAQAMVDDDGIFRDFQLDEKQMHELKTAALMHDVGKIATPDQVLEKSKKLEQVYDKLGYVNLRFRLRELQLHNAQLTQALQTAGQSVPAIAADVLAERDDIDFIASLNTGSEFLDETAQTRLHMIAKRSCQDEDLIEDEDLNNLLVARGTLNFEEREIMKEHANISLRLLNKLPWPQYLAEVPEIAGKHHENCDGSGYPKGLDGADMSWRAKILSMTDRFEGLSAPDRTYRQPKTLAQVMAIMQDMSDKNQIEPTLFEFFLAKGIHLTYAKEFLGTEQLAGQLSDAPPDKI